MRQMSMNSLAVFSGRVQPNLTAREEQVLEVIETIYPTTLEGIANNLNVPEHTISGRITGLKKKGLIKSIRRQANSRNNQVDVYVPVTFKTEWENG